MKKLRALYLCAALLAAVAVLLPLVAGAATVVNDSFSDGSSINQDLANNSIRLFKGRTATVRTDAVGSVTFDMTNTGTSAEAFWGFFTNSGLPVNLSVGEKLTVSGTFSLTGFVGGGQDVRFGVLNSGGTRNAIDLTGGMNDASFGNDTAYALGFTPSGTGSPFTIYRRKDAANLTGPNNPFNTFGDFNAISGTGASTRQTLANATPYTLSYTIERLTATDTKISVAVTGGTLSNLNYTATESSSTPLTAFDSFGFRVGGNTFAQKVTFTNWKIDYTPALPVITAQPQPSNLTVQVGSNVTTSVAAGGNSLSYQWQKDNQPIAGNASAATPTLNLTNVQLADAGVYRAVVTNPGGSVASQPVTLAVSTDPVPPPPSITAQPVDTNAPLGGATSLSVAATGNNLFYQWFKNGALINGATGAALNFAGAQVSDSGSYTVVVSNSSGSVTSLPAKLLVVSTMTITGVSPVYGASEVNIDSPLSVTFDRAPKVGNTGRLRIVKEDGTVVDTIDMSLATQSRLNGSTNFNYFPIIVNGNTANIYPHQKLAYGQTYYVTLEPGVVTDASGAPFIGFNDAGRLSFTTKTSAPAAGTTALTVAPDNSGDFSTVQGAVDFVPANNTKRVIITVKKGTYTEIVYVQSNKPFVTVRGEDRNLSVIQYANNNNFNPASTTTRTMFGVDAADFTLENISLRNTTPQGGSQAEAFRGNNNRIALNRVSLYSFQDTLLLQGQSNQGGFVTDSYIEGDVDFVWGSGAVFFQNTELKMLRTGAFYNQARNGTGRNGYVFVNCKFTRAAGISGSFLNRIDPDDFPFSQVVLINTQMDGVLADPWQFNNPTNAVTAANYPNIRMWEYKSRDLSGNLVDVSGRAPISRQLTDAEAAQWSDPAFVLGGWAPQTKLTAAVNLSNLSQTYTGAALTPTVTTEPAGLNVNVTYNGSTTPPTAIGNYNVVATINDATYQGTSTGTLVIDRTPVTVTLSNLSQTFDGQPKPVGVNTTPLGAAVNVTYNGSTTPPSAVGTYSVIAAINDPNFQGGTSATLNIYAPGTQPVKAFPGAEGAGEAAKGGRGGDVYHVTNLNDSGAGSLREGIRTASGPRTIVFDVSGTINLLTRLNVNKSFLTIAGQTAPGDGVTVAGHSTVVSANNVIVRYVRFRMGDINCPAVQDDAFWVDKAADVIIDHVSASWSVDETLSVTESDRVTVQWSFITESMRNSCHEKGAHGYGSLIRYGSGLITYHHNLYAHHDSRNPRVGDNIGLDFVNNVIYDWGIKATYTADFTEGITRVNYVGNYLVAGPMTPASSRTRAFEGGSTNTQIYLSNNFVDSNLNGARDGSNIGTNMLVGAYTLQQPGRFQFSQVNTDSAQTAYERVLAGAGHSLHRDAVDERITSEVKTEGGRFINSQTEVGGYPVLNPGAALNDADGDGIPDQWEGEHGLNPSDAADGRAVNGNGYTNLERYLNSLVPAAEGEPAGDFTAPAATHALSQSANDAGWHNSDLTVTLGAADEEGGSGVYEIVYSVNGTTTHAPGASATIPVNAEGETTVTYYAKDYAGNAGAAQTVTVKLDKTAPVIGDVTRTQPNDAGWNNTDVVANYTATDALSGFASGPADAGSHTFDTEGTNQSFNVEVADLAGNKATQTIEGVNIDKTAPAVSATRETPANAAGWNNTDVTVNYSAADALSGLAAGSPAAGAHTVGTEGANQSHTFTVTDLAGNTGSATVGGINIDKTAPQITAVVPDGAAFTLNQPATVQGVTAIDLLSGVAATAPAAGTALDTSTLGAKSFTAEAIDFAGNRATRTATYTVGFAFQLLFDNTQVKKAGSTIPVKVKLVDFGGNNVSSASLLLKAQGVVNVSTQTNVPAQDSGNANPDGNFRFDPTLDGGLGGYTFNLSTKGYAPGNYVLLLKGAGDANPDALRMNFEVR
jgi:pectin methylesterase-like acyl-CoA thioesterase